MLCKICSKRLTRNSCPIANRSICENCKNVIDQGNYNLIVNDVSSSVSTTSNLSESVFSEVEAPVNIEEIFRNNHETPILDNDIQYESPVMGQVETSRNFKDALLASLYSQVEFLRNEIEEKNLLIRTLIIKDHELNYNEAHNSKITSEISTKNEGNHNEEQKGVTSNDIIDADIENEWNKYMKQPYTHYGDGNEISDDDDDYDFDDLYMQYQRDMDIEKTTGKTLGEQLKQIRAESHIKYKEKGTSEVGDTNQIKILNYAASNRKITFHG